MLVLECHMHGMGQKCVKVWKENLKGKETVWEDLHLIGSVCELFVLFRMGTCSVLL